MPLLSPRSYLFVPGSRPDRFAKACAAGADAVVIDLEDSVAAADKATARAAIAAWLAPAQPVFVRVNVANSEFFHDDLKLGGKPGSTNRARIPRESCIIEQFFHRLQVSLGHHGSTSLERCLAIRRY